MIKYGLLFLVGAYGAELLVAATSQGCACPKIYSPVCGTDGSTYTNACLLNCYSKMKPGLQVSHYGECKVTVPCVCTREYHPFCGTDGITYANECWLNCERKKNPLLQVAREGPCVQCACPYNYNPLCGSDGRTYSNQCEFDCQASQSSVPLKLLYAGECKHRKLDSAVRSLRGGEEGLKCRGCPFIYTPVCGTDGQTYSNHCMLECARITSNNPALKIKYNGQCRNCLICPLNYSPACGTDGKTYGNHCELDCTPGVTLAHSGPC